MEVIFTQFYKCSGRVRGRDGGQGWRQTVAGYVSADDMAGACQEVGLPMGDWVFQAGGCHRQSVSMTESLYM